MSMSQVALDQTEDMQRASGDAAEIAGVVETAIAEVDAIDGLPFGQVNEALDRIRELLVKAHRGIAKQAEVCHGD